MLDKQQNEFIEKVSAEVSTDTLKANQARREELKQRIASLNSQLEDALIELDSVEIDIHTECVEIAEDAYQQQLQALADGVKHWEKFTSQSFN
jgi:hypothetical protein